MAIFSKSSAAAPPQDSMAKMIASSAVLLMVGFDLVDQQCTAQRIGKDRASWAGALHCIRDTRRLSAKPAATRLPQAA
jgi:hypothetical protein